MKTITDNEKLLLEIVEEINSVMLYEQKALAEDHPESTCAAHHRGCISAYGHVLKLINNKLSLHKEIIRVKREHKS